MPPGLKTVHASQKTVIRFNRMTVFFLTSWFPSRVHPTNGNFVARHARLVARTHRVIVVAVEVDEQLPFGKTDLTHRAEDGYDVVHAYVGYTDKTPGAVKVALRLRGYACAMRRASREFGRPDLLHGHVLLDGGMVAALYAKWYARPFVLTEHSSEYHGRGALPGVRGALGRYACRKAKTIMPVTHHLGRGMRELNGLTGNYLTLSNVVDEKLYRLLPPPDTASFRLLHVSNFEEKAKNIKGLLRAFSALPEATHRSVTLHLAGDGDLEALQRMIDETGHPGITFSGPHTETEIAELMQECHAFVLFSNYENQPVVLLEAQMSGRPCIATAVGGIPDIVLPGKTGLLVSPGDEAALTDAMLVMRRDYDTYNLRKVRERAERTYSEKAVEAVLIRVYADAIRSQ